jgi:hypothetical protein
MGQYLATGLVTKVWTKTGDLKKTRATSNDVAIELERLAFVPHLYDTSEHEGCCVFTLPQTLIEAELLAFLEAFYGRMYGPGDSDAEQILVKLQDTTPSEWLECARIDPDEYYHFDQYGHSEYLQFGKPFPEQIPLHFEAVMLGLDGKIIVESICRHLLFFTRCMHEVFSSFRIAGALRTYITG